MHERRVGSHDSNGPCQWRLCVLISENLCREGNWWGVAESIMSVVWEGRAAVDCIQLREKSLDDRELLRRARQLVALCRPMGTCVIVNDRPDIAMLAHADGVHLGQDDLPCDLVRQIVGENFLIGVSTSQVTQAQQALAQGANYCGVGPMFTTATKQKELIVGPTYLQQYIEWGQLPHLAIGGITIDNVARLGEVGTVSVAVSSAVCRASNPAAVVQRISEFLRV